MKRLIVALALAALLAAPACAADSFLDALAPDALLLAKAVDGSITGEIIKGASWEIARDPLPTILAGRDLWSDLLSPTDVMGVGLSLDLVPDKAACIGGGYRDHALFAYIGAHVTF